MHGVIFGYFLKTFWCERESKQRTIRSTVSRYLLSTSGDIKVHFKDIKIKEFCKMCFYDYAKNYEVQLRTLSFDLYSKT